MAGHQRGSHCSPKKHRSMAGAFQRPPWYYCQKKCPLCWIGLMFLKHCFIYFLQHSFVCLKSLSNINMKCHDWVFHHLRNIVCFGDFGEDRVIFQDLCTQKTKNKPCICMLLCGGSLSRWLNNYGWKWWKVILTLTSRKPNSCVMNCVIISMFTESPSPVVMSIRDDWRDNWCFGSFNNFCIC